MKYFKFKATVLLLIVGLFAIPAFAGTYDCDIVDVHKT